MYGLPDIRITGDYLLHYREITQILPHKNLLIFIGL